MQMSRHPLYLTLALLVVAACDCKNGPGPTTATPDFVASPTVLSFESCPTEDENGAPVADVFPSVLTFTIKNIGRVSGPLSVVIQGNDAALFTVLENTLVAEVAGGETVELKVQFTPKTAGDATAEMIIDDGVDDTAPVKVTLLGSGSTLPAQPSIKISYEDKDAPGTWVECLESFNGSIDNCMVLWPDTYMEQNATLKMKIQNLGCPALKVTGIELLPFSEGEDIQFFIDKPAVPPSVPNPALLSLADGTQEMEVEVRFEPRDNGSFDGQRYAYMKVVSNSVKSPDSMITLAGIAAEPSLYTTPTFCDYTDPSDTCNGTKVPTTGKNAKSVFQVTNGGNTDITIESVTFRNPSQTRFAIGGANPVGKTITAGLSEPLEILYTDAPLFVTELLDIKGTSGGMPTNTATIRLQGGVLPCLYTTPEGQLDFSDTNGKAEKPVEICNRAMDSQGNGCGDLNITNVQVTQGPNFFKVKTPSPAGSTVAAGTCTTATIEFTPPVSGGTQAGTLDITSNDPDFTPYRLMLYSERPPDEIPVAVISGPPPQRLENNMSIKLSELGTLKRIDVYGDMSYDPPNMGPVVKWKWFLNRPNSPGAANAVLTQGGMSVDGKETTTGVVTLDFDPMNTGVAGIGMYEVYLTVFDSANQQSVQQRLRIDVRQ